MRKDVIRANNFDVIFGAIVGTWSGYLKEGVGFHINEQDAKNRARRALDALYFKHKDYDLTAQEFLWVIYHSFIKSDIAYQVNGILIESTDIPLMSLRRFIGEWIAEKRREYQENTQLFNSVSSRPKTKAEKKTTLTAAQYLLIEYFTHGELKEQPNPNLDKAVRHRELAERHNMTENNFSKAFKRLNPILNNTQKLSFEETKFYKKDLAVVLKYFNQMGQFDLARKVQTEIDSPRLN